MASPATIDPEAGFDAETWLHSHELPLERALKVAVLLSARLTAAGMENVRVNFIPHDRFIIDMEEGERSGFDQFQDIAEFIFSTISCTGNQVVANWIPTFKIDPALHLDFRLVMPVVYKCRS